MGRPKKQPFSTCHPDQPYFSKGLCKRCYNRNQAKQYYAASELLRERKKIYNRTVLKDYRREWAHAHKDYHREYQLNHRYNLSLDQYDALVATQHGRCAICQQPPRGKMARLSVDHNHVTGIVRGLLCITCNRVLGYFENTEWRQQASQYLALNTAQTVVSQV